MSIEIPPFLSEYVKQDGQRIILVDPTDGKEMRNDKVAAYIAKDDYYQKGIDLLTYCAPRCRITLRFGTHSNPGALDRLDGLRQAIMAHDVFIPEKVYWDDRTLEDLRDVASRSDVTSLVDVDEYGYIGEYSNVVLLALAGTHKKVELIDINDADLERSEQLNRLNDAWRAERAARGKADPNTLIMVMEVTNYFREWIMLAKLGYALESSLASLPASTDCTILISIGALHYNITKKMKPLGVTCAIDHTSVDDTLWQSIVKRSQLLDTYEYTEDRIKQIISLF